MKKLSEYKNGEALDLLAVIFVPLTEIMSDRDVVAKLRKGGSPAAAVSVAIKKHKSAVLELMAGLDGVPVDEYECGVFTLPARLLEIISDKDLMDFFASQGQKDAAISSGAATESIKGTE